MAAMAIIYAERKWSNKKNGENIETKKLNVQMDLVKNPTE